MLNETSSYFKVLNSLELVDDKFAQSVLLPFGNSIFYNTKNVRLYKKNIFGEGFLVNTEALKWELKNETKKIGEYICNKAIAIEMRTFKGKTKKYPIIAWYCPEINAPFGPIGVSGLPGLILEVNKSGLRYVATEINLNTKKDIQIGKFTKVKRITQNKLDEMMNEAMGNFKKNKGY